MNSMIANILSGCLLIGLTCIIHTVATRIVLVITNKVSDRPKKYKKLSVLLEIDFIVLLMILAILIESTIWAGSYLIVGAIEQFEEALYFSIVTFTTLGYGDVIIDNPWRLMASFEAANGVIIFGWSTAIVMTGIQKLFSIKIN
jgi:hypothetical protein